jgi:aryl-alcohol dehydrogenase-like predicted oxidoreductase
VDGGKQIVNDQRFSTVVAVSSNSAESAGLRRAPEAMARLGLGTVQFGLDYGVSSQHHKSSYRQVEQVLTIAQDTGIRWIDTAPAYGDSESVLGRALPQPHSFCIVTKTPIFEKAPIESDNSELLIETFYRSLDRLRTGKIYGLLCHHAGDLLRDGGPALFEAMQLLKSKGLVEKIGVSVYTRSQLDELHQRIPVDLVQVPFNVLDQRMDCAYLRQLKSTGVEIHARSAFLQGLLLMRPEELPPCFSKVRPTLERFHAHIAAAGYPPVQAALGFVLQQAEIDCCLVGICSPEQLTEVVMAIATLPSGNFDFREFSCEDQHILDPSQWPIQ